MTKATTPRAASPPLEKDHPDYSRALGLWNRWLETDKVWQAADCSEECEECRLLSDLEDEMHDDMGESVHALAAVLMIEMRNGGREDVGGLMCASLRHIRPQLVGAIAEAADRVLAQEEEDA